MNKNNGFKMAALAASIALAMVATSAMAAGPAATQLPGQGAAVLGTPGVSVNAGTATMTITLGANSVINWGAGSGPADPITNINSTGVAGFNIGSGGTVNVAGAFSLLNVDSTGNPSQIFGALTSAGNVYVANSNGIIVGAGASITGSAAVGLIGNTLLNADGTRPYAATSFGGTTPNYAGSGGGVTVQLGASVSGTTVLISGGGAVNVDLGALTGGAGTVTVQAGVQNSTNALILPNAAASLTFSGTTGLQLVNVNSAGNATNNGALDVSNVTGGDVAGVFTNNGSLNAPNGYQISGSLVNNGKVVTGTSNIIVGMTPGTTTQTGGSLTNQGTITTNNVSVYGGDFTNAGTATLTGGLAVTNGSVSNSGQLTVNGYTGVGDDDSIDTLSDDTQASFTPGAAYSITNTGTITQNGGNWLDIDANDQYNQSSGGVGDTLNGSGGGFFNTGALQVNPGNGVYVAANNNIVLGGMIQTNDGLGHVKALSAANPLSDLDLEAGNYDYNDVFTSGGSVTLTTDVTTSGGAYVAGNQVNLLSNLSSVDGAGNPTGSVDVYAGAQQATGYSVRVAAGKTLTADSIYVYGDTTGDNPNVILQGTLAANYIELGTASVPVSDVFSGAAGGLQMWNNGPDDPQLFVNATGRVKAAPYLNDANFRYNYLPVDITDGSTLNLAVNADAQQGTPTSGYNLLVNSSVNLGSSWSGFPPINGNGSAVTGVNVVPNSHLVLQSTGSIATTSTTPGVGGDFTSGDFYWPGYIYLGNISTDATSGNALPGTLGLGEITTTGNFSNVLPGDISGASGIHFITQFPLTIGGDVTTNANAWVNFGADLLTQGYSTGSLPGSFFGGVQGPGFVINYGTLAPGNFVTQVPDATR